MSEVPCSPRPPDWLVAFPDLADIHDPVWLGIVARAQPVTIAAGTTVCHKGTTCEEFLLLHKGSLRVQQVSEYGREITLYRIMPGEISILALSCLSSGGINPAEAVAETDIQAFSLALPHFWEALAGSECFRNYVLSTLVRRLNEVITLAEDIAFQRLDIRLADTLCKLFTISDAAPIKVTHEDLAKDLGTTREVVSRLLKDFEKTKGCVKLRRGSIELVSPACLSQCAKKGFLHLQNCSGQEHTELACHDDAPGTGNRCCG